MLLYFGVTPYLVFDGDDLPSKGGTEVERCRKRQESKALGMDLYQKGRITEAYQELQKAVDVTPYMAREVIEELKLLKVQYVVAPYEADAQMAFLERQGIVNGIISEDSDLLVFGARRLLSKLDQHGECIEINRADFSACREISLFGWTDADFRRMCILSGCDYLPNIAKMGLKTAYRIMRRHRNVEKALRMLQLEGQYRVPADYLQNFKRAELTFLYQRVFCPSSAKLVTLTPPDSDVKLEELTFIGADMEPEIAIGVTRGDLDPTTKQPITLSPPVARKPAPTVNRRQTFDSSSDLKPNKPISAFFTPKRVPLAELDPNSLTPSPSQQRLLERHANTSWDPNPVTGQPSVVRSAPSSRITGVLTSRTEQDSPSSQASRTLIHPSGKRPRLCSETEDVSLPPQPSCRSRFFSNQPSVPKENAEKLIEKKKPRKSKLGIFSDEAAEEIMTQLPDPSQNRDDQQLQKEDNGDSCAIGEQTKMPSPSAEQGHEEAKGEIPIQGSNRCALTAEKQDSILSRFAFQPNEGTCNQDNNGEHRKGQASGMDCASGVKQSPEVGQGCLELPRQQRLTPLQRLGQSALSRPRSMNSLTTRTLGYASSHSTTETGHFPSVGNAVVHMGSEDMFVPDSEEEDTDLCDNDRREPVRLDLQKFSFTASQVTL